MQNQGTPQGGTFGGPSQPGAKKGLSRGCIIGIVAALALAVVGVILLAALGGLGYYLYGREEWANASAGANSSGAPGGRGSSNSRTTTSSGEAAEAPSPTEAQRAAVAGGQTAQWAQQEMSWTVPQRWSEQSASSTQLLWRSPGSWDAANLIVSISPMAADFPADVSINAFHQQAQERKARGEVNEVKWLLLDGLRGVMFREAAPEGEDDPQRLQWMGYRNYRGQVQLVNIMLSSRGKDFARHEDALYGILYTTDFGQ